MALTSVHLSNQATSQNLSNYYKERITCPRYQTSRQILTEMNFILYSRKGLFRQHFKQVSAWSQQSKLSLQV